MGILGMSSQARIRGKLRPVQNLGWLLRHWKEIHSFSVIKPMAGTNAPEAILKAYDKVGYLIYQTGFQSSQILWKWLSRPVFKGCSLDWFGEKTMCGAKEGMIAVNTALLFRWIQRI